MLFRTLQVLGAYGFRGYFERKKHFLDSIPPAIQNLRDLLKLGEKVFPYPYMMDMLRRLTELPQFKRIESAAVTRADGYKITDNNIYRAHPQDGPATFSKYDGKGPLVVRVYSFSFKRVFLKIRRAMVAVMSLTVEALITQAVMNLTRS